MMITGVRAPVFLPPALPSSGLFPVEFVIASTGNETLTSLLDGLSGRTVRARVWRGLVEGNVTQATIDEHQAIYDALRARDPFVATSAALMHVNTSESWLRALLQA